MEEGWSCWNGGEGGRKTEKQTRKKRKGCKVKMVDVGLCRGRFRNELAYWAERFHGVYRVDRQIDGSDWVRSVFSVRSTNAIYGVRIQSGFRMDCTVDMQLMQAYCHAPHQ